VQGLVYGEVVFGGEELHQGALDFAVGEFLDCGDGLHRHGVQARVVHAGGDVHLLDALDLARFFMSRLVEAWLMSSSLQTVGCTQEARPSQSGSPCTVVKMTSINPFPIEPS
jgi:hypothetical protein